MDDDLTPEEKTAASIDVLWGALKEHEFADSVCVSIVIAATPTFVNHYLKGQ